MGPLSCSGLPFEQLAAGFFYASDFWGGITQFFFPWPGGGSSLLTSLAAAICRRLKPTETV